MNFMCALLLCLILAADLSQGGYPEHIEVETHVLGFLAFSNEMIFCNVAFVTDDKGIAATTCFKNVNMETTEIIILAKDLESPSMKPHKIQEIIKDSTFVDETYSVQTHLALIFLEEKRKINLNSLLKGLGVPKLIYGPGLTKIYGYEEKSGLPSAIEIIRTESLIDYGQRIYHTFHFLSDPKGVNLKGAPVFHNHNLVAICEDNPKGDGILCLGTEYIISIVYFYVEKNAFIRLESVLKDRIARHDSPSTSAEQGEAKERLNLATCLGHEFRKFIAHMKEKICLPFS